MYVISSHLLEEQDIQPGEVEWERGGGEERDSQLNRFISPERRTQKSSATLHYGTETMGEKINDTCTTVHTHVFYNGRGSEPFPP